MTDASVELSVSLFNVLRQGMIIRTQLSEPPRFNTQIHTQLHFVDSSALLIAVYVCVLGLSCYTVPVPRTEEPFVFQSQPVETRGRCREEEVKRGIKDG